MKQKSIFVTLLSLLGFTILSTFLWVIIFSMTITPEEVETIVEPFPNASFILGTLTTLVIYCCLTISEANRLSESCSQLASNIRITEERNRQLLSKANRFVDKHQEREKENLKELTQGVLVSEQSTVVKERMKYSLTENHRSSKVETSREFAQILDEIPDLNMPQAVSRLFDELLKSEKELANYQRAYNEFVAHYNTKIKAFPLNFLKKWYQPKEYYVVDVEDEFPDELLGL